MKERMSEEVGTGSSKGHLDRLGVYSIEAFLGKGGMGEVYLAWDELLERHVAVKRIRPEKLEDEAQRTRFRREARAVARLNHPAIVQVYHVLEREDGDCLVMEYVRGRELRALIESGEIALPLAVDLARQIAEGLEEAHGKGMVHRDLKPANVMVTPADRASAGRASAGRASAGRASAGRASAGRAKILDFGLAKAVWSRLPEKASAPSETESLTGAGMLVGTVHAMSPEQAGGGVVDHRSDLFALGGLLYEMLTGQAPFQGTNVLDTLRRVITLEPAPVDQLVPEVPRELVQLVTQLLSKDPNKRPPHARLVVAELAAIARRWEAGSRQPPVNSWEKGFSPAIAVDPNLPTAEQPSPWPQRDLQPGDRPPLPSGRLEVGQAVPRRKNWNLAERLGEGGFGEVWLARHKSGREGVFKFCFEAERLRALKREVTLFRLLREALGQHPNIARILDWDFEESPYYLEMEYTDGGSLELWADRHGGLTSVPLPTRLNLVAEVAEALAAAHSVGILHKDVKPQNVLVAHDSDGRPLAQLTDFGIGLLTDRDQLGGSDFTVQGFTETIADAESSPNGGTVRYMAPELLEGQPATIQADIFSLGVLLFQMAVGDFRRSLAPGWRREIGNEVLIEDIASCVDGDPEHRLASAGELSKRLRNLEEREAQRKAARRRQQEQVKALRRRRFVKIIAAVASFLLAVVSFFAYQAFLAKELEVRAHKEAEQRRQQAEKLIDYMLGDLRDKLEPMGKLEILSDVGDAAMEYFSTVPAAQLSEQELENRAKALHQIGDVRFQLGDTAVASQAFRESLRHAQALAALDPDNTDWQFQLGQSEFWVAFLLWKQGELDGALRHFENYREVSEGLVVRDPKNVDWQMELAYSHSNLATLRTALGDQETAREELTAAIEIFAQRVTEEAERSDLKVELAVAYDKLGELEQSQGKLLTASESFEQAISLLQQVLVSEPGNASQQLALVRVYNRLALVRLERGELEQFSDLAQAALRLAQALVDRDRENTVWQRALAVSHGQLATHHLLAGNLDEARFHSALKIAKIEALLRKGPQQPKRQIDLANAYLDMAQIFLAEGVPAKAQESLNEAFRQLREVEEVEPQAPALLLASAQGKWIRGNVFKALGQVSQARSAWEASLQRAAPLLEMRGVDTRVLRREVVALIALGRCQEAQPKLDRLQRLQVRHPELSAWECTPSIP